VLQPDGLSSTRDVSQFPRSVGRALRATLPVLFAPSRSGGAEHAGDGPRRKYEAPAATPERGLEIRVKVSASVRAGGGAPAPVRSARGHT
jgi:hypothetical protein